MPSSFLPKLILGCAASMILSAVISTPAWGHSAPVHEHSEVVPLPTYSASESPSAEDALRAAQALIKALGKQDTQYQFDLKSRARAGWSNLPAAYIPREGLSIDDMSESQRKALFDFLSASLGPAGYKRVAEIMAAEAALADNGDGSLNRFYRAEDYFISFYGTPSDKGEWGWQFGGHHLGVNISFEDGEIESLSPLHLGSEPVTFTHNGVKYENMVDMHAAGLALFKSLSSKQQKSASQIDIPHEVVTGPGREGDIPKQEGLYARDMNEAQRDLLLKTIALWVTLQPDENAQARMAEIKAELDDVTFGWDGDSNPTDYGYYRIQGPSVVVEHLSFGSQRRVATDRNGHYHTMYRNLLNDYGGNTPE